MFENQKKRENVEIKEILHKSPTKRSFRHRIHSLLGELMPEEALTSFTVSDAYRVSLLVWHCY